MKQQPQPPLVKIKIAGDPEQSALAHIPGDRTFGGWDTLCGIDATDDAVGHLGAKPAAIRAKVTCPACIACWVQCQRYTKRRINLAAT